MHTVMSYDALDRAVLGKIDRKRLQRDDAVDTADEYQFDNVVEFSFDSIKFEK